MTDHPRRDPIPFHPRFNELILRGEKTVTRRFRPRHVDQWLRAKNPVPGKRPDQWPGFADLVVTDCRSVRLHPITEEEARLEGLGSVNEFEQVWRELYPSFPTSTRPARNYERWENRPPVWRIEFRCLTPPPARVVPLEVEDLWADSSDQHVPIGGRSRRGNDFSMGRHRKGRGHHR